MHPVYAQVNIGNISTTFTRFDSFGTLVSIIVQNVLVLSGVAALIVIVAAGFSVIMGAGGGDSKRIEQGKNTLTMAIVGLLVVFGAYWIVQIIEIITGMALTGIPHL